ncbi:ShlB/FhaC/HecB family hemolysin secretion/activation protein [Noviherbaspirillum sp. UKPF54]|uniref:ShlB/FhaC/HecB family hemolysin secretion/activation protein n=1 Tax=Noviherbaspirillum sp. UKPF54 TaxID=2601898 RepID=UPI0011B10101|nr:ShlB/FhaC/HecB family hemolysin secretion/activation protein [Noviherbaspirillum sp. UKPF54]QDZ29635.1 ShlB/FhaC/HecB family hemolysin secretion/activation protein [Noviherbaspirillum sp. UKPF54]
MKHLPAHLPLAALVLAALPALAQQQPDAGRVLQENTPPQLNLPRPSPGLKIETPSTPVAPGGAQVALQGIAISGNTIFSQDELLAALGDVSGKSYDFAGLNALARSITAHYQAAGYPFARAYLPPQDLSQGQLRIQVVEGHYGKIVAHGEPAFTGSAQRFLSHLRSGDVIETRALERVTLLLDDQPGIRTVPVVRPGQEVGSGDLLVEVQRDHRYSGDVGLDNHGNRFTGRNRVHLNANADSPFMLGDQIALQSLYTDERMWFGSLAYHLPLGSSGLRGRVAYTHSFYSLAGDFGSLDASGTADVTSIGLSYPIIRSQQRNLVLAASFEHKQLKDRQGAAGTSSSKTSSGIPVALSFDVRDQLYRAGITYGSLSWTRGSANLDDTLASTDQSTARTSGSFNKFNLDLARIQSLAEHVDLYGRASAQWTGKNLDSSEKFGLGGINGVRAYPSGEGFGDDGWLAQVELRYASGPYTPFLFYDAGRVKINHDAWAAGDNHRSIAGGGAGLRYARGPWSGALTLAWRTRGGAPRSDTQDHVPIAWASMQYRF